MSKKIKVNQVMVDMAGTPLKEELGEGGEVKEITLGYILVNALLHPRNEDEKTSGETKVGRFTLAQSIHGADEVEIGNSDISMLKKLVNNVYTAIIVGQVYKLLDDAEE